MSIETATEPRLQARRSLFGACAIEGCKQPQHSVLPLCENHAWDIWSEMNAQHDELAQQAAAENKRRAWEEKRSAELKAKVEANRLPSEPGTIYYLQIEDHIKIGYTTNLAVRLAAYPPMARLRATHPGTLETEASMHERFAEHLSGRKEWFRAGQEIELHMEVVRNSFKQDHRVTA